MQNDEKNVIVDYLSDFVQLEWLDERRIAFFTVLSSDRKDVATWADKVEQVIATWRKDSPYAVLHDVRKAFISPYARKRAHGLMTLLREHGLAGRYAVVVSNNVFGQAIATFVNFALRPKAGEPFMGKTFTTHEAALAWLREQF